MAISVDYGKLYMYNVIPKTPPKTVPRKTIQRDIL